MKAILRSFRFSATSIFIAINVSIFIFLLLLQLAFYFSHNTYLASRLLEFIALNPIKFFHGYFWTALTSIFVHLSFSHLIVNMISLFFIGSFVERLIGRKRYISLYLLSGIIASLSFVLFTYIGQIFSYGSQLFGSPSDFAVGASGALFGIAGLLAVLLPRLRVLVFFVIPMPMWLAMIALMAGLWVISALVGLPIGNTAHLGGLIVGLLYGFYLRTKYTKRVHMLGRMFK